MNYLPLRRVGIAAAAIASIAAFAVPAVASAKTTTVTVKMTNFKMLPSVKKVAAGKVEFVVKNTTTIPHEMVVIKTTKPAAKLPTKNGKAVETGKVGTTGSLAGKKNKTITLTLKKATTR